MKLLKTIRGIGAWTVAGGLVAWTLFYVLDFVLYHSGTGFDLSLQGIQLITGSTRMPTLSGWSLRCILLSS
jgi:hypothetical protein